jgi:hypothetical protein
MPTSVGASSLTFGNDYNWPYTGGGVAKVVARGGNWVTHEKAGVFTFYAADPPSSVSDGFGFRCGKHK